MTRDHKTKKLLLVIMAAVFVLISIAIAAQFDKRLGASNMLTEIRDLQFEAQITDRDKDENIPANTYEQTPLVPEEDIASLEIPSSEDKVKEVRVADNVSRGTRTTNTVSRSGSNTNTNFWQSRQTWLQPVKGKQIADPTGGARYFGARRADGRAHAAIDFIAPSGTLVYAMTDGKVIRTSIFFQNTSAVEVKNTDGTVTRYGEIEPSVSVGETVRRGNVLGTIITNYGGTSMLHLEMYMGTSSGSLSQNNPGNYKYVAVRDYERRSDLIDPTQAKDLPVK